MDPCIIHNSRGSSRKTIAPRTIEPRRSIPQRARWLTFAGANAFAREGMQTFGIKIPIALPCPCSVTSFYDSRAVCDQIFIDPNRKPIARECEKLGQSSRIDVKGKSPDARMDDEGVKISADSRSDTIMQRSCVCVAAANGCADPSAHTSAIVHSCPHLSYLNYICNAHRNSGHQRDAHPAASRVPRAYLPTRALISPERCSTAGCMGTRPRAHQIQTMKLNGW